MMEHDFPEAQRFGWACEQAAAAQRGQGGIGTLGERTLHAVLKYCYEPDEALHEQPLAGAVADIAGPDGVVEVQTRGFAKLRGKLERFLELGPVTVVYPVAATKWLVWVDPATGECTNRRKSPKRGLPYEVFGELYWLKALLAHPNFRLHVVLLDLEEHRLLNGWSADGKRGGHRCERIPTAFVGRLVLACPAHYAALVPPGLEEPFTGTDFAGAAGLSRNLGGTAVNILHHLGVLRRDGKRGRSYLYCLCEQPRHDDNNAKD